MDFMQNKKIRQEAESKGVYLWEIAERLGVTDSTFSRKLRRELPEEEQTAIIQIIKEISIMRGV